MWNIFFLIPKNWCRKNKNNHVQNIKYEKIDHPNTPIKKKNIFQYTIRVLRFFFRTDIGISNPKNFSPPILSNKYSEHRIYYKKIFIHFFRSLINTKFWQCALLIFLTNGLSQNIVCFKVQSAIGALLRTLRNVIGFFSQ